MDTDIALESTRFARHNILVQASAAMTAPSKPTYQCRPATTGITNNEKLSPPYSHTGCER